MTLSIHLKSEMGESSLDSAMKKKIAAHPSRLPAQIHDLN
jgi:hypothetical protein